MNNKSLKNTRCHLNLGIKLFLLKTWVSLILRVKGEMAKTTSFRSDFMKDLYRFQKHVDEDWYTIFTSECLFFKLNWRLFKPNWSSSKKVIHFVIQISISQIKTNDVQFV